MQAKDDSLAVPFVLLVDPKECLRAEDFNFDKKNEYHYWVLGGNHSVCAKLDFMSIYSHNLTYSTCQAWVYVGLTPHEARVLSWGHNIDNEFRSKMNQIQRICYIHARLVESGENRSQELKLEIAQEINLRGISGGKNKKNDIKIINNFDHLFQLGFRTEPIWGYIKKVFDKWEQGEIKGQRDSSKKKKSSLDPFESKASDDNGMRAMDWRALQGMEDTKIVIPVLQWVTDGDLTIKEMSAKLDRHKFQIRVEDSFCKCLHLKTFLECQKKFPEHCREEDVREFGTIFKEFGARVSRKKEPADVDMGSFPPKFVQHIVSANNWHDMQIRAEETGQRNDTTNLRRFQYPELGPILYEYFQKDATKLHEYVVKRPYSLAVADIPSAIGALAGDVLTKSWGVDHITSMVQSFKVTCSSRIWRFVIIHTLDQRDAVLKVFSSECNGGVEECIWYKPNVQSHGPMDLSSNFQMMTIGFHKVGACGNGRCEEHFAFASDEEWTNVVTALAILQKLKHS
ncbi:unnamed protein product [Calypogeia fissa]